MELVLSFLTACWVVFGAMAPYLLLGFIVAGVLSVVISPEWVERHLGGSGFGQIFKASLLGVPLPLCSCGVIPVAASLRRHGAGKGATTAFLLSTPQTGVDSIAVTYALLGPFLAVFRPLAALVTGLVGGGLVHLFDREPLPPAVTPEEANEEACAADGSCCADEGEPCCGGAHDESQGSALGRALRYGLVVLPRDIGRPLVVGILLSGLISVLVAPDTLRHYLGTGIVPMLAAMAIGIPLYVCATASVPIALGLIHAGLSPGAALVFLISGPATNAAALATLWKVLGRKATVLYLLTVAICSLGSGLLIDAAINVADIPSSALIRGADPQAIAQAGGHEHHEAAVFGSWFQQASAVALLGVLAFALWPRRRSRPTEDGPPEADRALVLEVEGMTCSGCARSLTRALEEVPGVTAVEVDVATGLAKVRGHAFDPSQLQDAVSSLGFELQNPEILGKA